MDEICTKNLCTGCLSCLLKCKHKAIDIESEHGFIYPKINSAKCNDCGLCKKVCPSLNIKNLFNIPQKCYFAVGANSVREGSSSGGVAYELALALFRKQALIVGCVMSGFDAVHIIAQNEDDLKLMQGSKYIQSKAYHLFASIKDYLTQGKKVLFVGTPCQVAGLKRYLTLNYENLITVDLICHGVVSSALLDKIVHEEVKEIESKHHISLKNISNIKFRDKRIRNFNFSFNAQEPLGKEQNFQIDANNSLFYKVFNVNLALRRSCGNCQYATGSKRVGDLTLGDFRGNKGFSSKMDGKGASIVFINSHKGQQVFDLIKDKFIKLEEVNLEEAKFSQANLKSSSKLHPASKEFIHKVFEQNMSVTQTLNSDLVSKNVAILNFHFEGKNFGAVLTAVALNKVINDLGYNAVNIDYHPFFGREFEVNPKFEQFKTDNLPLTEKYTYLDDLTKLNEVFKSFVVGSDQVLNHSFIKEDKAIYYLNFINCDKNAICYAGSFGAAKDSYLSKIDQDYKDYYSYALQQFDALSLREFKTGSEICNALGVENVCGVLDPVFLVSPIYWQTLAHHEISNEIAKSEGVVYEVNDKTPIKNQLAQKLSGLFFISAEISPYEFLAKFSTCKFVLTDSFHGTCFALIFNKPFVVINSSQTSLVRIKELFAQLDSSLESKIIDHDNYDAQSIKKLLNEPYQWDLINSQIQKLKLSSLNFLQNALGSKLSEQRILEKRANKEHQKKISSKWLKHNILKYRTKRFFSKILNHQKVKKYDQRIRIAKLQLKYFDNR